MQACDVLAAELTQEPVVTVDCCTLLRELRLNRLFMVELLELPGFASTNDDDVGAILNGLKMEICLFHNGSERIFKNKNLLWRKW